ncbi:MAG: 5'/3'-nucleotidase SurE [Deltaproteobacteria bacterium]|nr:MAG: 5'/3'-nucleotidase SurE [Deltaproteobacteria bacterium]
MNILLSNDDGVDAPGLRALAEALSPLGRVVVVAPDRERNAVAHALTLHRPLRLKEVRKDWYSADGTPTDCVHLGVHAVLERPPELLVAGINAGGNLGDDLTYSGTVGVALEGALLGVPSMAVSLVARGGFNFVPAARVAAYIAGQIIERGLPERVFLNVNVPNLPEGASIPDIRVTTQGRRIFGSGIVKNEDPRGGEYYWIGGSELGYVDGDAGSDVAALADGCISVTPLHTDLTFGGFISDLSDWELNQKPGGHR